MNTIRIFMLSLSLSLFISAVSFAQYDNDEGKNKDVKIEKHDMKGKQMQANNLKLTDQQKTEINKIRLNSKKVIMPLRNQLAEKRAHLKTLSTADKPNMADINKTIDEITGLTAQIMKQRAASRQDIRKLLTDDQRMIFDTRPQMNQKMRKRTMIKEFREE